LFGALPDARDATRFPASARPVADAPDDPQQQAWSAMAAPDRDAVDRFYSNMGKAIAAFERHLISRDAPFDRFVAGLRDGDGAKLAALSLPAQRGLRMFIGSGQCHQCHVGPNFTDGEFHSIGLPPLSGAGADRGRFVGIKTVLADPFNGLGSFSDDRSGDGRA